MYTLVDGAVTLRVGFASWMISLMLVPCFVIFKGSSSRIIPSPPQLYKRTVALAVVVNVASLLSEDIAERKPSS